jgi:hypothetical protein
MKFIHYCFVVLVWCIYQDKSICDWISRWGLFCGVNYWMVDFISSLIKVLFMMNKQIDSKVNHNGDAWYFKFQNPTPPHFFHTISIVICISANTKTSMLSQNKFR